jgi:hypothetical protein
VQYELVDEYGYVVARFDLAYPELRLAIEYDGRDHLRREFDFDDRWRDGTTADDGWHTMRFGYDDVMITRARTVQLVRNQLATRATPRRATSPPKPPSPRQPLHRPPPPQRSTPPTSTSAWFTR